MPNRHQRSQAQEKRTAKVHGGRVQPGSGNGWAKKGDVRTQAVLIENKRTDAKQITLRADVLEKIWTEAWAEGRMPEIHFELNGRHWIIQEEGDHLDREARGAHAGRSKVVEPG